MTFPSPPQFHTKDSAFRRLGCLTLSQGSLSAAEMSPGAGGEWAL